MPVLPAGSRHAGASAHARRHVCTRPHAEDIGTVLLQGLGFVICVYFVVPQHSARQRQPATFHKPPGGAPSWW